jgi:hypothetical protein
MTPDVRPLVPLAALIAAALATAPTAALAVPVAARAGASEQPAQRSEQDPGRLLAAGGVIALSLGSLGGVALAARRQRGYLQRR